MSSILNKIWTALRGGAREIGDAVIDANGIRIFEQEIHDAAAAIAEAKQQLTDVMAHKMQAERQVGTLAEDIAKHEGYARKALEQGNETLALEVAGKIAKLETEHNEQREIVSRMNLRIESLKDDIKKAEKIVADHKRELSIVATTESVQKATIQVVENIASNTSALNSARESLERIKKRQAFLDDKLAAGSVLAKDAEGESLESKLKSAGINTGQVDAASVLERIRASKRAE